MVHIADPDCLKWVAVPGTAETEWQRTKQLLSEMLLKDDAEKVYRHRNRTVYRAVAPELGTIAVKGAIYNKFYRRIKARYVKIPRAIEEFYTTATFWKRGGQVPRPLALAIDYSFFGIRRVFVFLEWIENTVTLGAHIRDHGHPADRELWQCVAEAMVDCASKGLVHGGQNPDNILIADHDGERTAMVIDIGKSAIYDKMNDQGLVNDAIRLGDRLVSEQVCGREAVDELFKVIAEVAWVDVEDRQHWQEKMLARQQYPS